MPRLGAHRPIHPVAGTLRETAQGHFIRFAAARIRPDLARYAGRLLPGSSHGRSVDVDGRRTVTSTDYDEPALFVTRVALSMNGALVSVPARVLALRFGAAARRPPSGAPSTPKPN